MLLRLTRLHSSTSNHNAQINENVIDDDITVQQTRCNNKNASNSYYNDSSHTLTLAQKKKSSAFHMVICRTYVEYSKYAHNRLVWYVYSSLHNALLLVVRCSLFTRLLVSLSFLLRASIASRFTDRISTLLHNTCAKNQFWWMFFFLFFLRFILFSCIEKQQPEQQLNPNSNIDNKSERTHSIYTVEAGKTKQNTDRFVVRTQKNYKLLFRIHYLQPPRKLAQNSLLWINIYI